MGIDNGDVCVRVKVCQVTDKIPELEEGRGEASIVINEDLVYRVINQSMMEEASKPMSYGKGVNEDVANGLDVTGCVVLVRTSRVIDPRYKLAILPSPSAFSRSYHLKTCSHLVIMSDRIS